jgi:7-keto-8-aminopelargonate synthetase-like enzyme
VLVSKHNDVDHLRYLVKRLKKEGYKTIWYFADGIYSMHGDVCNVKDLQQLLDEEEDFFAYVDDAHGVGWCGKNGSGYVIGNFGLHKKMIVAGSLSKSFATSGGFLIVPDKTLADYLKLNGHTFIFSIPMPPSSLGAINASLKLHLLPEAIIYQQELTDLIKYFKTKCAELDVPVYTQSLTPINLIKIGNKDEILKVQHHLVQTGFFASVAAHPAVSVEDGGIRVSVSRNVSKSDIDNFLYRLKQIYQPNKSSL